MHSHSKRDEADFQSNDVLKKKLMDINGFISSELNFIANVEKIKNSLGYIKGLYEKLSRTNTEIKHELDKFIVHLEILSCSPFTAPSDVAELEAEKAPNKLTELIEYRTNEKNIPYGKLKDPTAKGVQTFLEILNDTDHFDAKIFFNGITENIKVNLRISSIRNILNKSADSIYQQLVNAYPDENKNIAISYENFIQIQAISERLPRLPISFFDFMPRSKLFYMKSYDEKSFENFVRDRILDTNVEAYIIAENKFFYVASNGKEQFFMQKVEVTESDIAELKEEFNYFYAEDTSWKIPAERSFISVIDRGLNLAHLKIIKQWLDKNNVSITFISPYFSTERSLMRKLKRMFNYINPLQKAIENKSIAITDELLKHLDEILSKSLDQTELKKPKDQRPNSEPSSSLQTQGDIQDLIEMLDKYAKYLNIDENTNVLKVKIKTQLKKIKEYPFSNKTIKEIKKYMEDLYCASNTAFKIACENRNNADSLYQLTNLNELLRQTNDLLECDPTESMSKIKVLNDFTSSLVMSEKNNIFNTPHELGHPNIKAAIYGILTMIAGIALLALPFVLAYCSGGFSLILSIFTTKLGIGLLVGGFTLLMGGSFITTGASTFFSHKFSMLDCIQNIATIPRNNKILSK